jgi:hypothetical protein
MDSTVITKLNKLSKDAHEQGNWEVETLISSLELLAGTVIDASEKLLGRDAAIWNVTVQRNRAYQAILNNGWDNDVGCGVHQCIYCGAYASETFHNEHVNFVHRTDCIVPRAHKALVH